MRIPVTAVALSTLVLLSGCAVKKDFSALDGSRTDGTLDMAYDYKQFEKPNRTDSL